MAHAMREIHTPGPRKVFWIEGSWNVMEYIHQQAFPCFGTGLGGTNKEGSPVLKGKSYQKISKVKIKAK